MASIGRLTLTLCVRAHLERSHAEPTSKTVSRMVQFIMCPTVKMAVRLVRVREMIRNAFLNTALHWIAHTKRRYQDTAASGAEAASILVSSMIMEPSGGR